MTLRGIVLYTGRAFAFALPAGLLYLVLRRLWLRRRGVCFSARREALNFLLVFYLAALGQITVIRDWGRLFSFSSPTRGIAAVQMIPLLETIRQSRAGPWAVVYPVAGNILWFFPLGFLTGMRNPDAGFRRTALLSAFLSLSIEVLQWLLGTGISDIDDVIFNVCGALLGLWLSRRFPRRRAGGA